MSPARHLHRLVPDDRSNQDQGDRRCKRTVPGARTGATGLCPTQDQRQRCVRWWAGVWGMRISADSRSWPPGTRRPPSTWGPATAATCSPRPPRRPTGSSSASTPTRLGWRPRRGGRPARPSRGGLPNALFVVAAVEALPAELEGVADLVTVHFPWGSLLRGLLGADPATMSSLTRVLRPGANLQLLVSSTVRDRGAGGADPAATLQALAESRHLGAGRHRGAADRRRRCRRPLRGKAWGRHPPAGMAAASPVCTARLALRRPGAPHDPVRSRHAAATRPAPTVAARVGPRAEPGARRPRPHPQRLPARHRRR